MGAAPCMIDIIGILRAVALLEAWLNCARGHPYRRAEVCAAEKLLSDSFRSDNAPGGDVGFVTAKIIDGLRY